METIKPCHEYLWQQFLDHSGREHFFHGFDNLNHRVRSDVEKKPPDHPAVNQEPETIYLEKAFPEKRLEVKHV